MAITHLLHRIRRKHPPSLSIFFPSPWTPHSLYQIFKPLSSRPLKAHRALHKRVLSKPLDTITERPMRPETSPLPPERSLSFMSRWSVSAASTAAALPAVVEPFPLLGSPTPFDRLSFQYYLPHISNSDVDLYTTQDWVAYDMREPNEQAETEQLIVADLELPFIREEEFNYYPETCRDQKDRSVRSTDKESLVLRGKVWRARLVKEGPDVEFWLEKMIERVLGKFRKKKQA